MNYLKILEEYDKQRNTVAFYKTQPFQKLWRSVRRISKAVEFQKVIGDLREEYKIPPKGFIAPENEAWTHPPKEWKLYQPDYIQRMRKMEKIRKQLRLLCMEYHLPPRDFIEVFEKYLFYNELLLSLEPNSHNLIYITDLLSQKDSIGRELTPEDIKAQPVAMLISPYATSNDILDYVRRMYTTEIEPLQKAHRNPKSVIGKQRRSDPEVDKRDQFIYENRELSSKELLAKANKLFPKFLVDPGHLGKIISRETKKRTLSA